MEECIMKDDKLPKKPLMFYYIISLVVLMLLNQFIFPQVLKEQITEVDYRTFLNYLDEGAIKKVEVTDTQILFTVGNEEEKLEYFTTGKMPDDQLTERLSNSNVDDFGNVDAVWPLYRRTDTYRTKYGYWLRMRVNSIMVSNNITIDYRSYDWGESIVIYQNGTQVAEVFEYTKEKNKDYTKYEKLYFFIKSKYK